MTKEKEELFDPRVVSIAQNVRKIEAGLVYFGKTIAPKLAPSPLSTKDSTHWEHVSQQGRNGVISMHDGRLFIQMYGIDSLRINDDPIISLGYSYSDSKTKNSFLSVMYGDLTNSDSKLNLYMYRFGPNKYPIRNKMNDTLNPLKKRGFNDADFEIMASCTATLISYLHDFLASR